MGGFPFVAHWVQPGLIEVDGDSATARFYIQENIKDGEGNTFRVVGVYNDTLARIDGDWKFKTRHFDVMYRGPVDLTGDIMGYPEGR